MLMLRKSKPSSSNRRRVGWAPAMVETFIAGALLSRRILWREVEESIRFSVADEGSTQRRRIGKRESFMIE